MITWTNDTRKLSQLIPDTGNPRQSTEKDRAALARSKEQFGQPEPVLIGPKNELYNGHQRLASWLAQYGDIDIDVRVSARALTAKERKQLTLALHATATGRWNWDELDGWDFKELDAWGFDDALLTTWEHDAARLGEMLADEPAAVDEGDAEPQIDRAEELREKWQVETGQLWQIGEHRLICGDCTDRAVVDRVMGGDVANLVHADPPYGMNLDADYTKMSGNGRKGRAWENVIGDSEDFDPNFLMSLLSYCTEQFWWGADYYAERIPDKNKGSFLVWDKTLTANGDAGYNSEFEICWSKSPHKREVIHFNWFRFFGLSSQDAKTRLHPTQKPLQVIEPILEKYSKQNGIIFDPFGGSGTTMVACNNLGRQCRMIEISPAYCAVILERMATAFPDLEIRQA